MASSCCQKEMALLKDSINNLITFINRRFDEQDKNLLDQAKKLSEIHSYVFQQFESPDKLTLTTNAHNDGTNVFAGNFNTDTLVQFDYSSCGTSETQLHSAEMINVASSNNTAEIIIDDLVEDVKDHNLSSLVEANDSHKEQNAIFPQIFAGEHYVNDDSILVEAKSVRNNQLNKRIDCSIEQSKLDSSYVDALDSIHRNRVFDVRQGGVYAFSSAHSNRLKESDILGMCAMKNVPSLTKMQAYKKRVTKRNLLAKRQRRSESKRNKVNSPIAGHSVLSSCSFNSKSSTETLTQRQNKLMNKNGSTEDSDMKHNFFYKGQDFSDRKVTRPPEQSYIPLYDKSDNIADRFSLSVDLNIASGKDGTTATDNESAKNTLNNSATIMYPTLPVSTRGAHNRYPSLFLVENIPLEEYLTIEQVDVINNVAKSRSNFAQLLLYEIFEEVDRLGSTIASVNGYRKLDERKIAWIIKITFLKHPLQPQEQGVDAYGAWKKCKKAIDAKLREEFKSSMCTI